MPTWHDLAAGEYDTSVPALGVFPQRFDTINSQGRFGADQAVLVNKAGLRNRFGWTFEGTPPPPVFEAVGCRI
jgi:hypothetical protein